MNFSPFETSNCRDGKSKEEEIKAWQFWHQRQQSVSVIITFECVMSGHMTDHSRLIRDLI